MPQKKEELQQGAQQVVLHRACLCLCGRLTTKILKSLSIRTKFANVLWPSTLISFTRAWNAPNCWRRSFSFLQLFFVINLLQKSQCTEQNCMFFFTAADAAATAAAAPVSHFTNKHVCIRNGLRLIKQLSYSIVSLRLFVSCTRTSDSYEALVRVSSPLGKHDKVTELSRWNVIMFNIYNTLQCKLYTLWKHASLYRWGGKVLGNSYRKIRKCYTFSEWKPKKITKLPS